MRREINFPVPDIELRIFKNLHDHDEKWWRRRETYIKTITEGKKIGCIYQAVIVLSQIFS